VERGDRCARLEVVSSVRELSRRGAALAVLTAVTGAVIGVARDAGRRADVASLDPAAPGAGATFGEHPVAGRSATSGRSHSIRSAEPAALNPTPGAPSAAPTPLQLPRGGRTLFPAYRLVGYSGGPGSAAFGRLGVGDLDQRVGEIERLATSYAAGRRVLPVLELIAVVAQSRPGPDGSYRYRIDPAAIRTYLDAARRHRALLLLNIQPGRARFIDEVRALEPWLRQPDVGVALDPEWAVRRGIPGEVFGRTTGAEIDQVAGYLAGLVSAGRLPDKPLIVHQLAPSVVQGLSALRAHRGVPVVKCVDGIGPPAAKIETWTKLVTGMPVTMRPGFKLFFSEDVAGGGRLMTAAEVLALRPVPDYVLYE
jgi:hypothetical protein